MDFYQDADTATIFLGDEFTEMHREFPITLPYDTSDTLAVFILDQPYRLDAKSIQAAMAELGIENGGELKSIDSIRPRKTEFFAFKNGGATVWLVTSERTLEAPWRIENKKHALADVIARGGNWLAVGTAGLNESERRLADKTARRLAAKLVENRASAIVMGDPGSWTRAAYPGKVELISEWTSTGRVDAFKDESTPLSNTSTDDVAAGREFERALRQAVREFETSPGGRLEVVCCVFESGRADPLRLRVEKVNRTYGALTFDGVLVNSSALVPELRAGLPMTFGSHSVRAARLNDDKPIRRQESAEQIN